MTLVQERMEEGSEVVKIVAAEVEDYRTGTITYLLSLLFMIIALVPRLGQRDPADDDVGGGGRRSVVSRLIIKVLLICILSRDNVMN